MHLHCQVRDCESLLFFVLSTMLITRGVSQPLQDILVGVTIVWCPSRMWKCKLSYTVVLLADFLIVLFACDVMFVGC